ncbi:MAG TPA: glycosyltransferase family 9 protein [Saprospiraceae bacterium]|nr:glycosyltransferase family 9 protein [Saprospiraceae bacterium]
MTPPKKVLIIRFSSIGDIVLTSPVIRAVHQQWGAEVHFLTKAAFADIVEANPRVSKVFSFRKKLSEITPLLKAEKYDLVIDLHRNIRSFLVKLGLKRPAVSFDKLNREKWLLTRLKINQLPDIHIVDRYLAPLVPFGIQNDGLGLDFFIPQGKGMTEDNMRKYFPNFDASAPSLLAIAVGAAHQTKRIPLKKLIAIAQQWPGPVALLGGPKEKEDGEHILAKTNHNNMVNFCGSTTLFESASIISYAQKLLTPDTGMMHIAAALGTPTVSVWGNTVPEFGMTPYPASDKHQIIEIKQLKCRPCSKIGYQECPKGHFRCMMDIPASQILNALSDE